MRIRKKLRRSTKQYIIVSLICIIVIGGAAAFTTILLTGQIRDEYQLQLHEVYDDMQANQRDVYVAAIDIYAGDAITEDKLEKMKVYSSQPMDLFIKEEDIGRIAIIDIQSQTQVLTTMLTGDAVASELREVEYNVININSNIVEKDTVDLRICYPNGESYVVLSKKILKGYSPETAACYFWANEEEQLRMSAAIVDAGLYTGSYLYVTKYIEPNIQDPSIVNYTPSLAILSLLENDPNILNRATQELNRAIRKRLENRLAMSMDLDVSEINWDVNPNVIGGISPAQTSPANPLPDEDLSPEQTGENGFDGELGIAAPSDNFNYFIEEVKAKESDIEYGE
jgi:hypothetical protein